MSKITTVKYSRNFELARFIFETIGLEVTLEKGDDYKEELKRTRASVIRWHKENNPQIYKKEDQIKDGKLSVEMSEDGTMATINEDTEDGLPVIQIGKTVKKKPKADVVMLQKLNNAVANGDSKAVVEILNNYEVKDSADYFIKVAENKKKLNA